MEVDQFGLVQKHKKQCHSQTIVQGISKWQKHFAAEHCVRVNKVRNPTCRKEFEEFDEGDANHREY